MRTWLGISTNYLDPALRQHLEIPEGFGVQIVEVMPGSPAAAAKLRANDVLVRFGDQRLISPEHLALLVRERARGDRVSLTLIRKGREEVVEAELGESDEVAFGPFGAGPRFLPVPPPGEEARQWQDRIRKQQDEMLRRQQDYWHQWMDKHRPGWRGGQEPAKPPKTPGAKPGEDAAKPGGGTPGLSVSPGFPLHIFGTEGVLKIDNEQGELTLTRKDGNHHLLIQDHLGKLVYDGPFDPEKGVEGLPENARRQLEAMKLGNLEIRLPEPPVVPPGKTADPDAGKDKPTGNEGELL